MIKIQVTISLDFLNLFLKGNLNMLIALLPTYGVRKRAVRDFNDV